MDRRTAQVAIGFGALSVAAAASVVMMALADDASGIGEGAAVFAGSPVVAPMPASLGPPDMACATPLVPRVSKPEPGPNEGSESFVCGCPTGETPSTPAVDLRFLDPRSVDPLGLDEWVDRPFTAYRTSRLSGYGTSSWFDWSAVELKWVRIVPIEDPPITSAVTPATGEK